MQARISCHSLMRFTVRSLNVSHTSFCIAAPEIPHPKWAFMGSKLQAMFRKTFPLHTLIACACSYPGNIWIPPKLFTDEHYMEQDFMKKMSVPKVDLTVSVLKKHSNLPVEAVPFFFKGFYWWVFWNLIKGSLRSHWSCPANCSCSCVHFSSCCWLNKCEDEWEHSPMSWNHF